MLDDSLSFELDLDADGGLELDCLPSTHLPRVEQPRQSSFDPPPSAARPSPHPNVADRAPPSRPGAQPPPSRPSRPDLGLPLPPPPSRPNGAASNPNGPPSSSRATNRGMAAVAAPPASTPRGAGAVQATERLDQHAAIVRFSGFGDPPARILAMPGYAMRVMRRKRILKEELARAKTRGSHDVGLYEAALRAADDGAVRSGVIVMIMALVLALLLVATMIQVCGLALPITR